MELQPQYPLDALYKGQTTTSRKGKHITVQLTIPKDAVRVRSKLVDRFFFSAVLLYGSPLHAAGMRCRSVVSDAYKVNTKSADCSLSLGLPAGKSWLLFLKVSCLEEGKPAIHPKYYAMKVLDAV